MKFELPAIKRSWRFSSFPLQPFTEAPERRLFEKTCEIVSLLLPPSNSVGSVSESAHIAFKICEWLIDTHHSEIPLWLDEDDFKRKQADTGRVAFQEAGKLEREVQLKFWCLWEPDEEKRYLFGVGRKVEDRKEPDVVVDEDDEEEVESEVKIIVDLTEDD